MKQFSVQAIIFDLDGTLVDTAADLHAATNHTLRSIGRPTVPLNAVKADVGYGAIKLIERGLNLTGGLQGHSPETLRNTFLDYYTNNIAVHSRLFPGGLELLKALKAHNISMGVCTNKPHKMAVQLLETLRVDHFFKAIKGGDSFPFKKPDPRHIEETAQLLGEGPFVMVGDASPDILGAQAANIPVIAASYGYPDTPLEDLQPDAMIHSLNDIADLLVLKDTAKT